MGQQAASSRRHQGRLLLVLMAAAVLLILAVTAGGLGELFLDGPDPSWSPEEVERLFLGNDAPLPRRLQGLQLLAEIEGRRSRELLAGLLIKPEPVVAREQVLAALCAHPSRHDIEVLLPLAEAVPAPRDIEAATVLVRQLRLRPDDLELRAALETRLLPRLASWAGAAPSSERALTAITLLGELGGDPAQEALLEAASRVRTRDAYSRTLETALLRAATGELPGRLYALARQPLPEEARALIFRVLEDVSVKG